MSLLQMSVAGGALILFIVVVRALAIHRLPKTTFLVLWMIATLRLLLPFSIPLPFDTHISLDVFSNVVQKLPSGNITSTLPGDNLPPYDAGTNVQSPAAEHISIFVMIWLVGALLLVLYFSIAYLRSMRKFRMSIPDNTPYIQNWLTAHKIIRPIEVRSSDLISSPLTYGVLHPVILLPKKIDRNDQIALKYVLTHEYVHIRRFDAITKILFVAVLCIHWFNPFVWLMYVLANRDMELSCDAWVIRMIGAKNRSSYALMLIEMEERRGGISALCNYFGKNVISERIEAIMKFKKTSTIACALALVAVVGATVGATTVFAASANDDTPSRSITGIIYDNSKLVDIDLNGAGNKSNYAVRPVGGDDETDSTAPISINDAQSMDSADLLLEAGNLNLISVSHDDESKFTPEEWAEILKQIEQGTIYWED